MGWIPDDVIEAMRSSHQLAIFFRLDIDPPMRLLLGVNDMPVGIKSIDQAGAVYLGAGRLVNIPELEVLINGVADRVEFTLSGIDPAAAAQLDLQEVDVRGKAVHVAITTLDDHYQPTAQPVPIWTGRASVVTESQPPVQGSASPTITYALSAGAGDPARARVSASLWSHPHHTALFPGDDFCKGTARLARGVAPTWPRF